jgi:hypothetical protein
MTIYSSKRTPSIFYRSLYEKHYGPIPLDTYGRTYEIHHLDGNRNNNDLSNLVALTIEEHFDIHYDQKDWAACLAISMRMKKTPEEISKIQSEVGRNSALKRKKLGTNPFCLTGENHHRYGVKHTKESKEKIKSARIKQIMPREVIERAAKTRTGQKRTEEVKRLMSEKGKNRPHVTCPHCVKKGPIPQMARWHFDNCKENL